MTDEEKIRTMVRRVVERTVGAGPMPRPPRERSLVTELEIQDLPPGGELVIPDGALVTPLARQTAMERRVTLLPGGSDTCRTDSHAQPETASADEKQIAIGADHGGHRLKESIKANLAELGYQVLDCGTDSPEPVDYPDFALAVAELVAAGRVWRGIVVDGAGIGSCMAANKVPGVRAAMCYDQATAINSREHNHANVLTLGAGFIDPDLAGQIVAAWLDTPAAGGRHARRVDKITDIERRFLRDG